ncbi:MAG: hypothetical protein OQJ84_07545 [Xanthomonadales bacterium]|nr:hypothetical protein [Xanthomonadales bacterium]
MKNVIRPFFGILLIFAANAWAMDIQGSHGGSWYNPDQSGHGFSIEVLNDEKLVVYWFVYTPDGEPTFLVTLADIQGDTAYGYLRQYSGMRFGEFDPSALSKEIWGTLSITFTGCDRATVTYQSTVTHNGKPYGAGQIDLARLTSIDGLKCKLQLPEGKFGNFSTGLESVPSAYWPEKSFVWILRDGTLAYQVARNSVVLEIGYGHLAMTGEDTFEYEVTTSEGNRSGTGMFEIDRVTMDLDELGVLSEPLDPAFQDEVTYDELEGEYSGPDAIFRATVEEMGRFHGISIGGDIWGSLIIPEPGRNQLVLDFHFDGSEYGMDNHGVNEGVGIYDRASGNLLFISARGSEVFQLLWFG